MTTTTATKADEIRIVYRATKADAELIIAMQQVDALSGANEGFRLLRSFDSPPTLGQLRKRYPEASREYGCIMAFLGSSETIGTFVKQGLLDEDLVNDLYWVAGAWEYAQKACKGMRKETGQPRLFENFERLAQRVIAAESST